MLKILKNWIIDQGLDLFAADILARGLILVLILVLSLIVYWLTKHFIFKRAKGYY
jgi:hypothetical protein